MADTRCQACHKITCCGRDLDSVATIVKSFETHSCCSAGPYHRLVDGVEVTASNRACARSPDRDHSTQESGGKHVKAPCERLTSPGREFPTVMTTWWCLWSLL